MTHLKKLSENLNLKILNSTEAINLKGGRKANFNLKLNDTKEPPKTKPPGGGGAGLPPTLDSIAFSI
ncbi:MAG: hypothetical protein AB8F94_26165 [Saprospiraceae bacterium]